MVPPGVDGQHAFIVSHALKVQVLVRRVAPQEVVQGAARGAQDKVMGAVIR